MYYLRYTDEKGRRRYDSLGGDPVEASTRHRRWNLLKASLTAGLDVIDNTGSRASIADALDEYLILSKMYRGRRTHGEYALVLPRFFKSCQHRYLDQVRGDDLLKFAEDERARGMSPRTVANRVERLSAFFRFHNITDLLNKNERPRYVEREPQAFNEDDLRSLFGVCGPEDALLFRFFLSSGLREQEVAHLTYRNLNFHNKTITVTEHRLNDFRPKDRQERTVPVPDLLTQELAARRRAKPEDVLVFANSKGGVEGHYLRRLKKIAFRGGLNCNECVNRIGLSCKAHPVCSKWQLHSFRRSFATFHAEANIPVRRIQQWLGHSSLNVTLRYLDVAETRNAKTRDWVNTSFAAI